MAVDGSASEPTASCTTVLRDNTDHFAPCASPQHQPLADSAEGQRISVAAAQRRKRVRPATREVPT
eukprot:CAMPEP_0172927320 /NCGR_PEP_ID=MMETSP1075-20121228/217274_1 /TAXON_ID=2916 /ORGANISM="Ceratium fusus, Strain PA161109" /LENGTH=65 /DNA_ID=CAMNT_0013788551 /DNA_START=139 /DNA_END=334 /DNA_ORIENTATION=-